MQFVVFKDQEKNSNHILLRFFELFESAGGNCYEVYK